MAYVASTVRTLLLQLGPVAFAALVCVVDIGCGAKKDTKKSDDDSSEDSNDSDSSEKKKKKHKKPATSAEASSGSASRHPYFDEAGRQGKCEFVKYEGTGNGKKALFKMTPPAGSKKADYVQAWLFYYDKSGKHLSRYPHSTSMKPEPQALGQEGDKIPKDTATIECELTRITFDDKTFWFNANLVRNEEDRPKGGYPESELKTHTGEKVAVEVIDAKAGKVKLKNLGDKPIESLEVELIPFKADGSHGWFPDFSVPVKIKPGETVEATVKLSNPVGEFKTIEGTAPEVRYEDGSKFINHNLSGFDLPG